MNTDAELGLFGFSFQPNGKLERLTIQGGPKILGMPVLGFFGFIIAVFNSIWIVLSIWRSGKE